MPPRTIPQLLQALTRKSEELAQVLEGGRGLILQGRGKLGGGPVLTDKTFSDRATGNLILKHSEHFPAAERARLVRLVKTIFSNEEGRAAIRTGEAAQLYPSTSRLGQELGQANNITPATIRAVVKEVLSSKDHKAAGQPGWEESLRMAKGNPDKIMLSPRAVKEIQRLIAVRALRPTRRALSKAERAAGEVRDPLPPPPGLPVPHTELEDIRKSAEGALPASNYKGKDYPARSPILGDKSPDSAPQNLREASKIKARLSDLLPGLKFTAQKGQTYMAWTGQEAIPLSQALTLTKKEPHLHSLIENIVRIEKSVLSLPLMRADQANPTTARRLKAKTRYVYAGATRARMDKSTGGFVKAQLDPNDPGYKQRFSDLAEITNPADATERTRKWKLGISNERKTTGTSKPASPGQITLIEKLLTKVPAGHRLAGLRTKGLTATDAGKIINSLQLTQPRNAFVDPTLISGEYGGKSRIAVAKQFAETLEEVGQQRFKKGSSAITDSLIKATQLLATNKSPAAALLEVRDGLRNAKQAGMSRAQAKSEAMEKLLNMPDGQELLAIINRKTTPEDIMSKFGPPSRRTKVKQSHPEGWHSSTGGKRNRKPPESTSPHVSPNKYRIPKPLPRPPSD